MREPRPSRPLPHLSGAICTTDHVVSANLTAPRTPRAPAPGRARSVESWVLRLLSGCPRPEPSCRSSFPSHRSRAVPRARRRPLLPSPLAPVIPKGGPHPLRATEIPPTLSPSPASRKPSSAAGRRGAAAPGRSPSARHGKAPLRASAVGRRPESPQPTCSQRGWLRGSGSHPPCAAGARCGARGAASRGHPSLRRRPWARAFLLWGCFGLCVRKNGDVGPASPGL